MQIESLALKAEGFKVAFSTGSISDTHVVSVTPLFCSSIPPCTCVDLRGVHTLTVLQISCCTLKLVDTDYSGC